MVASTISTSAPSPIPVKPAVPPRWVRSLLKDSGLSDSSIHSQASTSRSTRQSHHVNYALMSHIQDVHEPDTAEEALSHPHWREAMVAEMSSIEDNGTWVLVPCSTHRQILDHLAVSPSSPTVIFSDSQSAIALAHNPVVRGRTKHIDVHYHFVRDYIEEGRVSLEYVSTSDNIADLLTKPLPRPTLDYLLQLCNVGPPIWS